jgi:hypothetical protein
LQIEAVCNDLKRLLIEKSRAYGDSAMHPVRIFSRASAEEQLRVRIDDKLARLMRGDPDAFGEDVFMDLAGYLVLLIAKRKGSTQGTGSPSVSAG